MRPQAALAFVLVPATTLAASRFCPPLPPPAGPVVVVATEPELQAAVASLVSGQTILVAPGTYDLTSTLVFRGGVVGAALRGQTGNRDDVVLRGRGMSNPSYGNVPHGVLVQDVDDLLVADLTIRDVWFHAVQVQGERGPARVRLLRLRLADTGEQIVKGSTAGPPGPYADGGEVACSILEYTDRARSDYTNGVDVLAGAGWVVRDNLFRNVRAPLGQLAGPAVLFWRNSLDTVVERNLFVDCDRAVALGLGAPDANSRDGETVWDHQGGVVRNNGIVRAAGSPTGDVGITVNLARDFRIVHNTVLLAGTFPWTIEYRFAPSVGEVANNLTDGPILARDGASATLTANLETALPSWFADAVSGDLHLLPGVPPIDAGVGLPAGDDLDGDPRPGGAAPDLGADERGCALPAAEVGGLRAVRRGADVDLSWSPAPPAVAFHVWQVGRKQDIELARETSAPPGAGVAGCAPPAPATATSCLDAGGVARGAPSLLHYQVRSACAGGGEGP